MLTNFVNLKARLQAEKLQNYARRKKANLKASNT